jgi:dihydrofolate synthase/folylpolyglutamate synthase
MKPGLSRIKKFLAEIKNPQNAFKAVQIAGTNGKGSTAVFLANILTQHKLKVGLYTSPHLVDICERIKIDGKDISKKSFNAILSKHIKTAKKFKLSYFEFLTAVAFIYFAQEKVDIAILETGLGGRFDATNVITKSNSLASIITSISFDHCEILGHTLSKIAHEKAGIIKNTPVICGTLPKVATKVIASSLRGARCRPVAIQKLGCRVLIFGKDFRAENIKQSKSSQVFDYTGNKNFKYLKLSMQGGFQIQNSCLAIFCAEMILGDKLNEAKLKKSLINTFWQARFDRRDIKIGKKKIHLIIDGAHNEESLKAFIQNFDIKKKSNKPLIIFAMMKEKNFKKAVKQIAPLASKIILPTLQNSRALPTQVLKKEFSKIFNDEDIIETRSASDAFELINNGQEIIVIGSLYLAGEVLKFLQLEAL